MAASLKTATLVLMIVCFGELMSSSHFCCMFLKIIHYELKTNKQQLAKLNGMTIIISLSLLLFYQRNNAKITAQYILSLHCKLSHPSIQSSALLMYGVGHAIQAGVNQEVFTACDMQSQFDRIDMLGLNDTALS